MKPPVVGPVGRADASQRKRKMSSAAGAFAGHLETGAAAETAPSQDVSELLQLTGLIALQSATADADERSSASRERGEAILADLDRLRDALLAGRIAPGEVAALTQRLRSRRGIGVDPALDAIVGEIELRAEVEIAKLGMRR
jgi:hypothetical protein